MAVITVAPGASISAAIAAAVTGDTVRLLNGTHVGGVVINKQITLEGESLAAILRPSVDGSETGVRISSNNCVVQGLTLLNFSTAISQGGGQTGRNNVQILNNHTVDCGFHCWINGDSWRVEGNDFDGVVWWSLSGDADYCRMFGSNHIFRRNHIHGTDIDNDIGPNAGGNYAHCDGIQYYGNNGEILHDVLIEENFFTDFVQGIFFGDTNTAGDIDGVIIRNNVFWGTDFVDDANLQGLPSWLVQVGKVGQPAPINVEIYQNLIYHGINYIAIKGDGATAVVENNIILGASGEGNAYVSDGGAGQTITGTGDYVFNVNSLGDDYNSGENIELDPELVNDAAPLGVDGIFFTADDGWLSAATDLGYGPQLEFGEVLDTTPPVVTLIGPSFISMGQSEVYMELGATAIDDFDGPVTVTITNHLILDTNNRPTVTGMFLVAYSAVDAADNAVVAYRQVLVVDDIIPVITLNGSAFIEHPMGTAYTDAGATMVDNYDGDLSAYMVTTILDSGGNVIQAINVNIAGTYVYHYNGSDSEGNVAAEKTRTVVVATPAADLPVAVRNTPASGGLIIL